MQKNKKIKIIKKKIRENKENSGNFLKIGEIKENSRKFSEYFRKKRTFFG